MPSNDANIFVLFEQSFDGSDRSDTPIENFILNSPSGRAFIIDVFPASDMPVAMEMELYGCFTMGWLLKNSFRTQPLRYWNDSKMNYFIGTGDKWL